MGERWEVSIHMLIQPDHPFFHQLHGGCHGGDVPYEARLGWNYIKQFRRLPDRSLEYTPERGGNACEL